MKFEWDDEKALANVERHGVSFGEATEIFYDPNALEGLDDEHSNDEDRFFIIGYSTNRVAVRRVAVLQQLISVTMPIRLITSLSTRLNR